MKRKILIGLSIIVFVVLSIFVVKTIKSELLKKNIANGIKDFLNEGKYCKYLPNDQMIWLNNAKSDSVNNYDITEFVNYIIETSKKCVAAKIGEYNITEHTIYKRIVPAYEGITIVDMMDWYYTKPNYMMAYITNEDIELYKNDKLEERLQNELKSKLDYKNGKWYVGGKESKKIDLIYGLYVNYTPDNRIENVKPKNILKIKLLNGFIKKIGYNNERHIDLNIKYINNNNEEFDVKKGMGIYVNDKAHFDLQGLASLYYSYPKERTRPKLQIHHYSKDAEDAEYREWERAKIKAEEERDPSTIIDHWDVRIIDKFKKYSDQPALQVDYMEDGSINAYIRLYLPNKKNGAIVNEYKKRKLPYNVNMPIEKVMEKYLSDEEQFAADENFLKNGVVLYEYETIVIN